MSTIVRELKPEPTAQTSSELQFAEETVSREPDSETIRFNIVVLNEDQLEVILHQRAMNEAGEGDWEKLKADLGL